MIFKKITKNIFYNLIYIILLGHGYDLKKTVKIGKI